MSLNSRGLGGSMMCLISTMSAGSPLRCQTARGRTGSWDAARPRTGRTRVAEQAQELDLSQDAGRVRDVVKHVHDALYGHLLPGLCVQRGTDHAIAALADHLVYRVPVRLAWRPAPAARSVPCAPPLRVWQKQGARRRGGLRMRAAHHTR